MGSIDSRSLVAGLSSSIVTSTDPAEDLNRTVVPGMGFTGAFSLEDVDGDVAVSEGVLGCAGVLIADDGAAEFPGVGCAEVGATEPHPSKDKLMARARLMPVTQASWSVRVEPGMHGARCLSAVAVAGTAGAD